MQLNTRKTTDSKFRNLVKKLYPGLGKNLNYWRFMRYLIFGGKDKDTGYPLIDQATIANAEDKLSLLEGSNSYCASEFLIKFQQEVMSEETFSWSGWSFKDHKARVATVKFPLELKEAIEQETYKMKVEERVYFDTGKKFSDKLQKIDRELIKQEALTYFNFAAPEARVLLEYMTEVSVNNFSKVIAANFDTTLLEAFKIEDPEKRRVNVEILNTIKDELQPFYKGSKQGNTVRIFPFNYSIPMLRKDLRKLITKGWYEFDLASSQLAIVGKTWEIPEVQEFLQSNGKIWLDIINHYGIDAVELKATDEVKYEGIKKVLKEALYSLIFGMGKYNLIESLDEGLLPYGIKDAGKIFLSQPIMKALFTAREARLKYLNNCDSVETIFGKVLTIKGDKKANGEPSSKRHECLRAIMAQQAQAVELYMLLPVVDLAKTTKDFVITIWQHDGFSVNFTDSSKRERWITKINEIVNQRAAELGVITHLEGGPV